MDGKTNSELKKLRLRLVALYVFKMKNGKLYFKEIKHKTWLQPLALDAYFNSFGSVLSNQKLQTNF